jgi:hypothetical protein
MDISAILAFIPGAATLGRLFKRALEWLPTSTPASRTTSPPPRTPMDRLVSRPRFDKCLREELRRAARGSAPCVVLVAEPSGGHLETRAARAMAWAVTGASRSRDAVTLLGPSCFAVLMPDAPAQLGHQVAARIRRALELAAAAEPPHEPAWLEARIGVIEVPAGWRLSPSTIMLAAKRTLRRAPDAQGPRGPSADRLGRRVA